MSFHSLLFVGRIAGASFFTGAGLGEVLRRRASLVRWLVKDRGAFPSPAGLAASRACGGCVDGTPASPLSADTDVASPRDGAVSVRLAAAAGASRAAPAAWLWAAAQPGAALAPSPLGAAVASAASRRTPRTPARARRRMLLRFRTAACVSPADDVATALGVRSSRLMRTAHVQHGAAPTLQQRGHLILGRSVRRGAAPLRGFARAAACSPMDAAVEAAEELHRQAAQLNKDGRFDGARSRPDIRGFAAL